MDEGAMQFLEWELNEIHTVEISGTMTEVRIVGVTGVNLQGQCISFVQIYRKSPA